MLTYFEVVSGVVPVPAYAVSDMPGPEAVAEAIAKHNGCNRWRLVFTDEWGRYSVGLLGKRGRCAATVEFKILGIANSPTSPMIS